MMLKYADSDSYFSFDQILSFWSGTFHDFFFFFFNFCGKTPFMIVKIMFVFFTVVSVVYFLLYPQSKVNGFSTDVCLKFTLLCMVKTNLINQMASHKMVQLWLTIKSKTVFIQHLKINKKNVCKATHLLESH